MRSVKWIVALALVVPLAAGVSFSPSTVWASGDERGRDDDHGRDGDEHGHDDDEHGRDGDEHGHDDDIDLSSFGECVASMETSSGEHGRSGERGESGDDHGEGHDSEHGRDEEHGDGDDDGHGHDDGEDVASSVDTDCTNRGLVNERRVSWKEIKLQ